MTPESAREWGLIDRALSSEAELMLSGPIPRS